MIDSWTLTISFVVLMGLALAVAPRNFRRSAGMTSVITTLGILGTFVGIALGLWRFNVADVQASIPELLEGLKVAFLTSIAGIVIGLAVRYINAQLDKRQKASSSEGATVDTLADLLRDQIESSEKQSEAMGQSLASIEKSLVGEGDATLITQIQKLRTTVIDKSDEGRHQLVAKCDEIIKEFNAFAEKVAEHNSKALIEALEQVIRDFNVKITEQFGDNFRQLNEAVGRMLTWQETYKSQMESLIERLNVSAGHLEHIDKDLREITDTVQAVMELTDELNNFLEATKLNVKILSESVEAHAKMAENARGAFPIIEDNLSKLTAEFADRVRSSIESGQQSVEEMKNVYKEHSAAVSQTSIELSAITTRAMNELSGKVEETIAQNTTAMNKQFEEMKSFTQEQSTIISELSREMSKAATKVVTELDGRIESLMNKNASVMAKQVEQLDKNLEQELKNSLNTLGSQLASLSRKFVDDYTPLTDKLREVVRLAEDGRHNS